MRRTRLFAALAIPALAVSFGGHAADIVLKDGWAQVVAGRKAAIHAYVTVANEGGMAMLVGAGSDIAGAAVIHSDTDGRPGGATRVVDRMMIAGGADIVFEPGEYIVVLKELRGAPKEGDRFTLRLFFADGTVAETGVVIASDGA